MEHSCEHNTVIEGICQYLVHLLIQVTEVLYLFQDNVLFTESIDVTQSNHKCMFESRLPSFRCCLMSSDVGWHIRDKLRPMHEHGSMLLYVHGNHEARYDGEPRTATSSLTQFLNYGWVTVVWILFISRAVNTGTRFNCLWQRAAWLAIWFRGLTLEPDTRKRWREDFEQIKLKRQWR